MANYNIRMSYFNGSSYDTLYPQTLASNLSGVLPANKGGTGQSSLSSAMYSLINSGITTSLSSSSYVPFITGSSANKCTISTLSNYIKDSIGSEIEIHKFGSYTMTNNNKTVALFTFDSSQIYSILYIEKNIETNSSLSLNDSEGHDIVHLGMYNIFTIGQAGNLKTTQYLMGNNIMGTLNVNGTNTVYGKMSTIESVTSSTITVYGINFV